MNLKAFNYFSSIRIFIHFQRKSIDFGVPGEAGTDEEAGSFEEEAESDMEPSDKVSHDVAFKPRLLIRKLPQRRAYSETGIPTADQAIAASPSQKFKPVFELTFISLNLTSFFRRR
jgi:hypothetical protein